MASSDLHFELEIQMDSHNLHFGWFGLEMQMADDWCFGLKMRMVYDDPHLDLKRDWLLIFCILSLKCR